MQRVSKEMVEELVHGFYGRVRNHPDLGPVFDCAI